jgi:hypothetical protein
MTGDIELPNPEDDRDLYDAIQELYREMEGEEGILKEALKNGGNVQLDKIVDRAKLKIASKFLKIVDEMADLARNAESESVKLNAQKACISFLTGSLEEAGKGSGLTQLLERLMNAPEEKKESDEDE